MFRRLFLPALILIFASFSVAAIRSIAPQLWQQQLLFYLVATIVFFACWRIGYQRFLTLAPFLYGALAVGLFLTLFIASQGRGTARWIQLFGVHIQLSQMAIPIVALFIAHRYAYKKRMRNQDIFWFLASIGLPAGLIFLQPDLGTSLVYVASTGSLLFLTPVSMRQLTTLALSAFSVAIFAWFFLLQPYQKNRVLSFIQPETNNNYNAEQALIAVGSGRLWGRGFGLGVQSQLRFLPERQTDFIFASIAEETGFVGSSLLLLLYIILVVGIWKQSIDTPSSDQRFFCSSIAAMFVVQSFVNIGMNIGLLPITGLTLPLVSYGGSSVLSLLFALGILQSLFQEPKLGTVKIIS